MVPRAALVLSALFLSMVLLSCVAARGGASSAGSGSPAFSLVGPSLDDFGASSFPLEEEDDDVAVAVDRTHVSALRERISPLPFVLESHVGTKRLERPPRS